MSGYMTHELPVTIYKTDGTKQMVGLGPLGFIYEVTVVSAAIAVGDVVVADPATTVVPRPDYAATEVPPKQLLRGIQGTATTTLGATLGVALDPCASTAGAGVQIRVAGAGSIVATRATANGTAGQYCSRGATGQVTPGNTVTALLGCGIVVVVGNISGGTGTKLGMLVQQL